MSQSTRLVPYPRKESWLTVFIFPRVKGQPPQDFIILIGGREGEGPLAASCGARRHGEQGESDERVLVHGGRYADRAQGGKKGGGRLGRESSEGQGRRECEWCVVYYPVKP